MPRSKGVTEAFFNRCIDKLESKLDSIDLKVDNIMSNHLPHMKTDIELLKAKQGINGDRTVKNVRSWKDSAKENAPWFGVAIISLIQIIQFLLGL